MKAAYGVPLAPEELAVFRTIAERDPPTRRVKELWLIIGARGGKDSVASMIAAQHAAYADEGVILRPGERALVACFATDRDQASIIYNYTRAYFEQVPSLRRRVISSLAGTTPRPIVLRNNTEIRVMTSSLRAPRGWPIACAIFDECAFWRDDNSANPDKEVYIAVLRGSGPTTMIIGISTPYRQSGLLYDKWKDHYGKPNDDILVIKAPTTTFRPDFDQSIIARAMEEDPERAAAEYGAEWRRDLADYVNRETAEAAVVRDRRVLEPMSGIEYAAFCDPSGGSIDSMTLAIGHADNGRGILDCLLERRAPFSPGEVTAEFAASLRQYGISIVRGDRYAGAWPPEQFAKLGVTYEAAEQSKSDIYRDFLPLLNTGIVDLLDHPRMINQLCSLERRTIRGGRDSIDHPPLGHDDLVNAAAGVLVDVAGDRQPAGSRWGMDGLVNR